MMTAMVAAMAAITTVARTEVEIDPGSVVGVVARPIVRAMAPTMATGTVAVAIAAHVNLLKGAARRLQCNSRAGANGRCRCRPGEADSQEPRDDCETKFRSTH